MRASLAGWSRDGERGLMKHVISVVGNSFRSHCISSSCAPGVFRFSVCCASDLNLTGVAAVFDSPVLPAFISTHTSPCYFLLLISLPFISPSSLWFLSFTCPPGGEVMADCRRCSRRQLLQTDRSPFWSSCCHSNRLEITQGDVVMGRVLKCRETDSCQCGSTEITQRNVEGSVSFWSVTTATATF